MNGPLLGNGKKNLRSILFLLIVSVWITNTAEAVIAPASYVIYKNGTTYYAQNGQTGVNDYSGTAASTVIQSALNALTSGRTWKEKVVLKGDFTFTSTVTIPSYTILQIVGKITSSAWTLTPVIRNSDQTNGNTDIEIVGGIFDGVSGTDVTGQETSTIIEFLKVQRYLIQGVQFRNVSGECIWNGSTTANTGNSYGVIRDCIVDDGKCGGFVCFLGGSKKVSVSDNKIYTWDTPLVIYNGTEIHVAHNELCANSNGGGPGIEIIPQQTTDVTQDISATDNIISSSAGKGIWIHHNNAQNAGTISNITIENNTIRNIGGSNPTGRVGIEMNIWGAIDKIKLIRNTIISAPDQGIFLANNSTNSVLNDSQITDNIIISPGAEAMRLIGIQNSIISNNRIQGSTGTGIHIIALDSTTISKYNQIKNNIVKGSTGTYGYGIYEDSYCNFNEIVGNILVGNAQVGILSYSTNSTIRKNQGYLTENSGTATIIAGQTSVNVTHGLASSSYYYPTPTRIHITPATDTVGKRWWVSGKGTSTFTITIDSAYTSDITFDWRGIVREE